jgi:hypothetical protein
MQVSRRIHNDKLQSLIGAQFFHRTIEFGTGVSLSRIIIISFNNGRQGKTRVSLYKWSMK